MPIADKSNEKRTLLIFFSIVGFIMNSRHALKLLPQPTEWCKTAVYAPSQ